MAKVSVFTDERDEHRDSKEITVEYNANTNEGVLTISHPMMSGLKRENMRIYKLEFNEDEIDFLVQEIYKVYERMQSFG